jgi:hypothetical protein
VTSTGIDFDVPVSSNVPDSSFISITEDEVFNAVMSLLSRMLLEWIKFL